MGHVSSERLPTFVTAEQGKKGEGPKLEDEAPDDGDAPPSDVRRVTTVTDEELRVFLALPDTQAQIRKVVLAGTVAIDFLVVPTGTFNVRYVFIVLSLERGRTRMTEMLPGYGSGRQLGRWRRTDDVSRHLVTALTKTIDSLATHAPSTMDWGDHD